MRKDKKSQYALKKEKLVKIKEDIETYHSIMSDLKAGKLTPEYIERVGDPVRLKNLLIEMIWEIVKNER